MTAAVHDQHLTEAIDRLRVAVAGATPLLAGAQGLRALMTALTQGQAVDPHLAAETSRLLCAVAPRIADAAAGRITPEHIYTALGCANAAITCADAPRRFGLIAFTAVLEAEIRALHLRDWIAANGQNDLVDALSRNPVVAPPYLVGPQTVH